MFLNNKFINNFYLNFLQFKKEMFNIKPFHFYFDMEHTYPLTYLINNNHISSFQGVYFVFPKFFSGNGKENIFVNNDEKIIFDLANIFFDGKNKTELFFDNEIEIYFFNEIINNLLMESDKMTK